MPCQHDGPEKKELYVGLWCSAPWLDCAREKFGLLPAFAPVHASGFIGQVPAALPPAPCVVGRQHSCAHALLYSPAHALIGIPNSLYCPTFCQSVRLLVVLPDRDSRINAKSLGVCFIGVKDSRLHWAGSPAL